MRSRLGALATLTLALLLYPSLQSLSQAAPSPRLVISGNGLNVARFGARERTVETTMHRLLGKPTTPLSTTPALQNCGVSAMSSWHALSVYFYHEKLVGLSLGPGAEPNGQTSAGLRLGYSLRRAKALYGRTFRTSTNQGGAWFIKTSDGRLDGFLVPSTGLTPGPSSRIFTINAGNVGCPAMSP
jgi:hypothetical protein